MNFEFATANRILFGNGALSRVAPLVQDMGSKALVVMGNSIQRVIPLLEQLKVRRIDYVTFSVPGEPTTELIDAALEKARAAEIDVIIGLGGGSVIDAGKAISALMTNPGNVMRYLEVIGDGKPLTQAPLPYIAIPSTAGTGTEVTKNAVLLSKQHRVKVSLRHNLMIPDVAVIDPQLTYSMPPEVTASTGLDALTQLIEPYVSNKANPLTDALCREGIQRAARSLPLVFKNGDNAAARQDMCLASLFGGLALANAKLGAVHGFAGPLGGLFDAPHGAICARLLPFVMQTNIQALQERQPESPILERYLDIAKWVTNNPDAHLQDAVSWAFDLIEQLHIPSLSQYGMTADDIAVAVDKGKNASSMKGNPLPLTDKELQDILTQAIG